MMDQAPSPSVAREQIVAGFIAALTEASTYIGATAPNPPVGCALLDSMGNILSVAAHQSAGSAHAEARALAQALKAGTTDRIHTALVTLEPCCHHGRTPPCTDALLGTCVREVIYGVSDPNPLVDGGGALRLRSAGLQVFSLSELGEVELGARCAALIAPFKKRLTTGLPFVVVKQAQRVDGVMTPPPGCKTFTSDGSLDLAHRLRKAADGLITGSGTILADDPLFTVRRVPDHPNRTRPLAVLDRRGRTPDAWLARARSLGFQPFLATSIEAALRELAARGANSVLVEAGPQVSRAVLDSTFWDELVRIRQNEAGAPDTVVRRVRSNCLVERGATTTFPSAYASSPLQMTTYRSHADGTEHLVLIKGPLGAAPLVRVHSECMTGDALGSLRCDCGLQLQTAIARISQAQSGLVLYLRGHEGRGIGLGAKIQAYALQDQGMDTVDANLHLGFPADARDYQVAAAILEDLDVERVRLLTNNPAKVRALRDLGLEIVERVPLEVGASPHNANYLEAKRRRMGHALLGSDFKDLN